MVTLDLGITLTKRKPFEITFPTGMRIELEEYELKYLRQRIDEVIPRDSLPITRTQHIVVSSSHVHAVDRKMPDLDSVVERVRRELESMKPNILPEGFTEIGRAEVSPRGMGVHVGNKQETFIYAKNPQTGEFGYRIINGRTRPFRRIGRLDDQKSQIGAFIRKFPKEGKFTVGDFYSKGVAKVNGTAARVLTDILTKEGYLKREIDLTRRGAPLYWRTSKTDGLGGESNDERFGVQVVSPNPIPQ